MNSKNTNHKRDFLSFFNKRSLYNWSIKLFILLIFISPNEIYAQACCSGGVPLGGSFGLGTANKNSLQFLFTYDFNAINSLINVSDKLDDDTRKRTTHTSILEVNYGLNDRFTITGLFPFIRQERNILTYDNSNEVTVAQGFGDVILMLKYRLLNQQNNKNWELVLGGGVKLPSGKTTHVNNNGLVLPADMQPGSGSLDGICRKVSCLFQS
jgi:hypothetical protein